VSWESRWRAGDTGWDRGSAAPPLLALILQDNLPFGRALVPGCGAGYDAMALARRERFVVGLDLAPTAAVRFEEERQRAGVPRDRVEIVVGDFFEYRPEAPFDLIWDYTFLCAIDPSLRSRWAEKMDELLAPHGELITLLYPTSDAPAQGPPFLIEPEAIRTLLAPRWVATQLAKVKHSHPERRDREWLGRWRKRNV
jgi:methyl halide transferase